MSDALRAAMIKSMVAAMQANAGGSRTDSTALAAQLAGGYGPAVSPLMQRYNVGTVMGRGPVNLLPRDNSVYNSGMFTPSLPTPPQAVNVSGPNGRPMPRTHEYPIGWNLPSQPGQQKMVPFKTLRSLAGMYDVAALCLDARKNELAGLDWDIVPREDAQQAEGRSQRISGQNSTTKGVTPRKNGLVTDAGTRRKIKEFWEQPDRIAGYYMSDWLKVAVDEILVIDALSIYEHPSWGSYGGAMGGDLFALELLDGSTIKPLLDDRGTRPMPPFPAYQQYLYGIPRSEFVALLMDAGDDPMVQAMQRGFPGPDDEAHTSNLSADQLAYRVFRPRSWTPYGFSNIEQIIINCNLALKRQDWHQSYFTDGDIPAMLIAVPDTWNPDMIQKYEAQWHTMLAGDNGWRHRMRAIPGVQKAEQLKPPVHDMTFDEWLARITCAGFGMDPAELGLTARSDNEQQSAAAAARRMRFSTNPLIKHFQHYFDDVMSRRLNQPDYVFRFEGSELQDRAMELTIDSGLAKLGGMSLNEMRAKRGMQRIDDEHADKPNVYLTRDIVPVDQIGTIIGAALDGTLSPGAGASKPSNSPTPRSAGGSTSGGSARNQKRSPSSGQTSTSKIAEAQDELRAFEKFVGKSRARRFNPEVLPESLVERVYSRMEEGETVKGIFADIRQHQALVADDVLGDIVERLLDAE